MTVLTKKEILKEIKAGNIKITPFKRSKVGAGSVDLHLGDEFRVFKDVDKIVHVNSKTDHRKVTRKVKVKKYITLMPGELVLGITKEKIKLAPDICGWLQGRSRYARMGLVVHMSSNFLQPGINNKQVLEIANMSKIPLALHPGTAFCQIIFERTEGKATYKGRFSRQKSV